MAPDEKIGEGQFRTLGWVFTKKTIEDIFISNFYVFEVMMCHHKPRKIDDLPLMIDDCLKCCDTRHYAPTRPIKCGAGSALPLSAFLATPAK
jgi:hypothetical protein